MTELLKAAIENGIIDLTVVEQQVIEMERKHYLDAHCYKIYEGKDGYWRTYLPDDTKKTGRTLLKKKNQSDLEDALINFYKQRIESGPTVKDIFDEWNGRKLALGKIKAATFMRNEQIFKRFFTEFGEKPIKKLAPDDFTDFLELSQAKFNLTARAFSNLKSIVRGLLKHARKKKLISFSIEDMLSDLDICEREFKKRIVDDSKEVFFDDEMNRILDYCKIHRDDICCIGVALMFGAGLRVGEVVALTPMDICEDTISITKTETRYKMDGYYHFDVSDYPKTPAGVRKVIVPEKLLWIVDAMKEVNGTYIFMSKRKERLHTQAIRKRLYQICEKLNMPVRSPHKIRKTYGSILLDNDVNSKIIEKQMGHAGINVTKEYYYRDRSTTSEKRAAINSVRQFALNTTLNTMDI